MIFAIVAYGQTGSGKTYTLTGDVWQSDGLLRRCLAKFADEYKGRPIEAKITVVQLY